MTDVIHGINSATGSYLSPPPCAADVAAATEAFRLHPKTAIERQWVSENGVVVDTPRLPVYGIDPHNLASAGWGVIFGPDVCDEIREALSPLLDLRRAEAGSLYRTFEVVAGVSKETFLRRRGVGFGPVDPRIVPYYLLLVGDPRTLPFRFQYELDMQYAVGRIHFDTADEYASYARSVVESTSGRLYRKRRLAFFATENPDDEATRRMRYELVQPLVDVLARDHPEWKQDLVLGHEALKQRLAPLLQTAEGPRFLFTATHGVGLPYPHARLRSDLGALLCQDWPGPERWNGEIPPEHYFSASDVSEGADVRGLVVFCFACYSAGAPREDSFFRSHVGKPGRIAEYPFVSRLAQRLLGHPRGGALAFVGHVDRAWTTSFSWTGGPDTKGIPEIQAFESTLKALLDGCRIGFATESLNQRYAEVSVQLSNLLEDRERRRDPGKSRLERLFRANNDARSFILIGDPAVRVSGALS